MAKQTRPKYSPEFRLEVAQQVVDAHRSVRDVAEAKGLEYPLLINGLDSCAKSDKVTYLVQLH
jgi:transposase-like protein